MNILSIILILLFDTNEWRMAILEALYIAGLWGMFKKSNIPSWWALIPCVRDYKLAVCAGREAEGRVTSVLSFILLLLNLIDPTMKIPPTATVMIGVVALVISIIRLVYSIRVYDGLVEVYGVRNRWIFLWILIHALPSMLWGYSKKYQPKWKAEDIRRDSVAIFSGKSVEAMGDGLTINLEERTVLDFFRKKYLLRDIHMRIQPGHMVLLLGGSGAGKTTFLNAVNGYEKAKAKVQLNGSDVYANYKKMQYEIGFVPQQELIRGKDTVLHTLLDESLLRLPTDISGADRKQRVEQVMEIFGLTPVKNSLIEKLSGGQKKRISIAMEFISNPSLFILDEPDSGLDGVMARDLMEQLRKIADQGKIVIVITHTPDRVVDLFDDVIVLAKDGSRTGRLAFFGPVEQAKAFFGKEKMEQIVMSINRKEEGGEGLADAFIAKYAEVQHA